ncbi:MAG: aminoacyl-tRNA hydrolase [Synergistota bacterium]|nr:aminoacyl-tRNA hydrolase [Synergistota bacterium]
MRVVVGLGNPGPRFALTRHNAGWLFLDRFIETLPPLSGSRKRGWTEWGPVSLNGDLVLLIKPTRYMNLSGGPVARIMNERGLEAGQALVVYDDVNLPFGRIRIRSGGSAGGHKGMISIIDALGVSDIPRLRIGVGGPARGDLADYVTDPFSRSELRGLPDILDRAVRAANLWISGDMERAMREVNGQDGGAEGKQA